MLSNLDPKFSPSFFRYMGSGSITGAAGQMPWVKLGSINGNIGPLTTNTYIYQITITSSVIQIVNMDIAAGNIGAGANSITGYPGSLTGSNSQLQGFSINATLGSAGIKLQANVVTNIILPFPIILLNNSSVGHTFEIAGNVAASTLDYSILFAEF